MSESLTETIGQRIALGWRTKEYAEPLTPDDITNAYESAMDDVRRHKIQMEKHVEFLTGQLSQAWASSEIDVPLIVRQLLAKLRGEGKISHE